MRDLYKDAAKNLLQYQVQVTRNGPLPRTVDTALQYLSKAVDIETKMITDGVGNKSEYVKQHINTIEHVAHINCALNRHDNNADAIVLYEKARQLREDHKLPESRESAIALQELADTYVSENILLDVAQSKYQKALEIAKTLYGPGSDQLIPFYDNFAKLNNSELVRANLEQALKIAEKSTEHSSPYMLAARHDRLASLYRSSGDADSANRHIDRGLALWRVKPAKGSKEQLGDESTKAGKHEEAISFYKASLDETQSNLDMLNSDASLQNPYSARLYQKLGDSYLATGNLKAAMTNYQRSQLCLKSYVEKYNDTHILPEQLAVLTSEIYAKCKLLVKSHPDEATRIGVEQQALRLKNLGSSIAATGNGYIHDRRLPAFIVNIHQLSPISEENYSNTILEQLIEKLPEAQRKDRHIKLIKDLINSKK